MNYIQQIAKEIKSEVDPKLLPKTEYLDQLFDIYAVLLLAKGNQLKAEDVHDAWSAWMNTHDPAHKSIVPFKELSTEDQRQDAPFLVAILKVGSRLSHSQKS